jgi:type IV pilus assembly protein PilN
MIRINLATSRRADAAAPAGGAPGPAESMPLDAFGVPSDMELQKQGALRLAMILLFPLALYLYELQTIPAKQKTLESKRAVLAELTAKNEKAKMAVEEIKKFKIDQQKLQSQISVLEGLKKARLLEVRALSSIQDVIPPRVWLTRVEMPGDPTGVRKLTLQGLAASDQGVAGFIDKLSANVLFSNVSLIRSADQSDDSSGVTTKKFEISCLLEKIQ